MKLNLKGIFVIVGTSGSGKTEISINLAINQKIGSKTVKVADLDLINPYFRIREARNLLKSSGIKIILPPDKYLHADLPILSPEVSGAIRNPCDLLILDVGGDGIGSVVLASLSSFLDNKNINMLCVVNPYRPFTDTKDKCIRICEEIENVSKIKINGLIGNPNIMGETDVIDIYEGFNFISDVGKDINSPVFFTFVPTKILPKLDLNKIQSPVLDFSKKIITPWINCEKI